MSAAPLLSYVEQDELLVDPETGEIIGYASAPPDIPTDARAEERRGRLRELVEWATERRARCEARQAALEAELQGLIAGLRSRFEPLIAEQSRRIAYIDDRYGDAMREFAREELAGANAKSVKTRWATLGFRASKGALEVTDARAAALWLMGNRLGGCVKLTVDLGPLEDASWMEPESPSASLFRAIRDTVFLEDHEEGVMCGVSLHIQATHVPDELPDGVGMARQKPECAEGKFYVKHS
jgi:hypothetical protein